jgi:hypothetical protein
MPTIGIPDDAAQGSRGLRHSLSCLPRAQQVLGRMRVHLLRAFRRCCNLEWSRGVIRRMSISASEERQRVAGGFWGVGMPLTDPLEVSDASCDGYE